MDQKFVYVVHNIKHLWVIMWHIFTSTNNTTTILFPTQLWELLYTGADPGFVVRGGRE